MSRRSKGARLWLKPERSYKKTGKLKEHANWVIRDGTRIVSTGCSADEVGKAEGALAAYVGEKYFPSRRKRDVESIDVADVLSVDYDDKKEEYANLKKLARSIKVLGLWWGRHDAF